ncbi:hypothetical protein F1654_06825 [Alkalicaulis satelles]|uniref:DUF2269 family protein n=1 Tax=Alkalicaulis satelles TaxID=2609175 RepID=A0A5M6ZFI2_9PROT|nr:hypothetical protein [Alkalicaulis satelles]KAA5803513.1 hypothetical protein F1654_06825 [Alkalicaulis satelles]
MALIELMHILVLVYWLGGDLGAFVASRLVADPERAPAGRAAAAKILMDVDMAPRMALIFAFPTGFALAVYEGWLMISTVWIAPAFALALVWAIAAWMVHLKAGPDGLARRIDMAIRLAALLALTGAGAAGMLGVIALPLFIAGKLLLLALAVFAGLMIRRALAPFGPAFGRIAAGQGDEDAETAVGASLAHARRWVFVIWAAVLGAAALGVLHPV